jgi:hypothetical protein
LLVSGVTDLKMWKDVWHTCASKMITYRLY